MSLENWLHCPRCRSTNVTETEFISNGGGIDVRRLKCQDCEVREDIE